MDIVIRATVIFFFVFALTRALGRRELSSLEPFDLILLVVTGDLVQQGVTQSDYSLTGALLAISTIGLLTLALSYASFRVRRLRPLLEGKPLVLIDDGRVVHENLRRERITLEELQSEARLAQLSSLDRVRWGILETDGKISFIPGDAQHGQILVP
ncbi:MAG: DUF421 domain-containing protein [Actinomycetota bacterium]|nr:DUF421 domain-containing protein [Actinomycetota bacterium]